MLEWTNILSFNFVDYYIWEFLLKPNFIIKDKIIGIYNGVKVVFWLLSNNYHTQELTLYIPDNLSYSSYWYVDLVIEKNLFLWENKLNTITINVNPTKVVYNIYN